MLALELFKQILGLFFIVGLGFGLVKAGKLSSKDSRIISVLCVYIIMPCVNLNAFQIEFSPEIFHGFLVALGIAFVMHALLFLISLIMKHVFHMTLIERLSFIFMNTGNLVMPLVAVMFGSEWVIYASAYLCVQTLFFWTFGIAAVSGQSWFNWKQLITNFNLIAAVIGIIMFCNHFRITGVPANVLQSISGTIGPLSMLMIGMSIASVNFKEVFTGWRIYRMIFFRLIVGGLLGVLVMKTAGLLLDFANEQTILTIVLFSVITPSAAAVVQIAQLYDKEKEYASAINVTTTLLCIITMPLMVALM